MRRIKLAVVVLFALPLIAGIGQRFFSPTVIGQTGGLAAPTGVIASDNSYSTKVGLNWDAVRGATAYRIFRGTTNNPNAATDLGATVRLDFFDATAVANQTYFYWLRAENGSVVSNFSVSETGVRAAGTVGGNPPLNPPPPAAQGNPVTATKAYLGKTLFWDEQLSSTRTVSCGTCHQAGHGGSDPRVSLVANARTTNPGADNAFGTTDDIFASPGVPASNADGTLIWSQTYGMKEQVTNRKSNSFINAAYLPTLFWDGRATGTFTDPLTGAIVLPNSAALESQIAGPPVNSGEMAHAGRNWNDVAVRVNGSKPLILSPNVPVALSTWMNNRTYPELFQEAFGTPEVTPARIAMAIASYERTLYSDRTPFDAAAGGIAPLTAQEQRGQGVFNQADCNDCHSGALLTDNQFHYIGVRPTSEDTGRFQVTGNQNNLGEFRTPSLRNVELSAPYMHNGRFPTLEAVVDFYNRGGDFDAPNKNQNIRPLGLNPQQRADLAAFLKRPLTDARVAAGTSPFDRPTLYTESNRVPQITGSGVAGTNGIVPEVIAAQPPLLGNPNFTVAVSGALGNSNAVLVIDDNDPGTTNIPASATFARINLQLSGSGAGSGYGSISLPIPNNPALIGRTFTGRWFVTDSAAPNNLSVSRAFRFTVFGEAAAVARAKFNDYDGDGKTDVSVFRPSNGNWYVLNSSTNTPTATNFGLSGDKLVSADYDGDGKTDIAVYRAGAWYILQSRDGFKSVTFGLADDKPQPADYDGDNIADIAVYRPSNGTWYILRSRDGFTAAQFGIDTDKPVAADYDADGKTDIAVYRSGNWYILRSTGGFVATNFGTAEDKPVIGDYDADGKSDLAVFRPSNGVWYYIRSSDNNFRFKQFGIETDTPTPGDYDGDGLSDFAVFRAAEGYWYISGNASGAFRAQGWGTNGDIPAPSSVVP